MRSLILALALVASAAFGQDLATYNKGLSAYNASQYEDAARAFYEVNTTATDTDLRLKAEYYLASTFQRLNLPFAASVYYSSIVKAGPAHPFHLKAVEGLVTVQEMMDDDLLIPSLLNKNYNDAWATLPPEVMARINYLIGKILHRQGKLADAQPFFEAVTTESGIYHKAQYMLGVTLGDPRLANSEDERRKNSEKAMQVFETLLKYSTPRKDLEETHELAMLGLGRLHYNLGEYQKAVEWYERIPRFSKFWDQALFENGWARFQNDDLGGGLGSLQALHAPQFVGAFQPESWLLKSTIYYFSCLYEEGKAALVEFEKLYVPMRDQLKTVVEGDKDFFKLVDTTDSTVIPKAVLNYVRTNERMLNLFSTLRQIETEKKVLNDNQNWKTVKLSQELTTYLDQNRATLEAFAGNEAKRSLIGAYKTVKDFADNAEIIRFEISKAEKEVAERGIDQSKTLGKQTLYRPSMPAENWNYWKFQGEFWRDEIGYYQYTLKKGCAE